MEPAVHGAPNGNVVHGSSVATHDRSSVRGLLEKYFPRLSAASEELLFTPDTHNFGVFDYIAIVNKICTSELADTSNHNSAVLWLAAAFLLTHKLIRTGSALDAHLSPSSPTMTDSSLLFQFCGKDQLGPRRATRALSVSDVADIYIADMEFLKPMKTSYSTFTGTMLRFAEEAMATPYAAVAIFAMLALACTACSCFAKLQAYLEPLMDPNVPSPGLLFPKENVLDDLMQSITGPLFGLHPLIATNAAMGESEESDNREIDWPETMRKYQEGLVWLFDWDVEGREDRDAGRIAEIVLPNYGPNQVGTNPTITDDAIIAREKNRVGCFWSIWDTSITGSALKTGKVQKLARHNGFLCHEVPDSVREIFVVTTNYFAYGIWPTGDWHDVSSIWHDLTSIMGCVVRGNMVDHDTEADIGEHNSHHWICKTCAEGVTEWAARTHTDPPQRTVVDQRLAWGPLTYTFLSRRHSGLARRVYSRKFLAHPGIQWGAVTSIKSHSDAIATPLHFPTLDTLVLHTLNLAGFTVDAADLARLCAAMPPLVDPVAIGLCRDNCAMGLDLKILGMEMMLYGHGVMVMAAMLPEPARRRFIWELDGYSLRAFPTLYSRVLSTCECSAYWIERVVQLGYEWALGGCGCDNCYRDEDFGSRRIVPDPVQESGRAWLADPRVRANLGTLKAACKERFESMPSIRQQIESGRLQESWSTLPCAPQVRAKMAAKGIKHWDAPFSS